MTSRGSLGDPRVSSAVRVHGVPVRLFPVPMILRGMAFPDAGSVTADHAPKAIGP